MKNNFYTKVDNCEHEFSKNYSIFIHCSTPYCVGYEYHCIKCGVYISECSCGVNNGMSGWSDKRWKQFNQKKIK
jgi:hypothetical protein